uniref:Carbon catabolite repressor protein 4 homolog 3 isoform X1 n=2 Tax=Rhizophora mucronata TaxID=61149 RepID=A0A2P2L0R8_RHIMU
MVCHGGSSSWLCPGTSMISAFSGNGKYQGLFSSHKSTTIFCCSNGPTHNSSSSSSRHYSRLWCDPLGRRIYDRTSPEMLRHWIEADQQPQLLASQERFTIVSYNILGVRNASKHRDLYPNIPSPYMRWDHRKRVICEELIGWNPDIICLQEVDRYFDLSNVLKKAGYVGSYKRRTGDNVDGCAMFWKANVVRLLEGESIEFKGLGLRDNVVQLCTFEADSQRCAKKVTRW